MRLRFCAAAAALAILPTYGQRGGNDWMTAGFDAQRSAWVRNDNKINPGSMQKPGFDLVWKLPVSNTPRGANSLTAPALIDFYIGYRGFRTLGFLGGSSDRVVAIDTDLGRVEWEKKLTDSALPPVTAACPGGMTSEVTRPLSSILYPAPPTGGGFGRGSPAKSAVGDPRLGAVTLRTAPTPAPPPPVAAAKATAPVPSPFVPRIQWLNVLGSDGHLHAMFISNGEEPNPAIPFLPPNANAQGLIAFDNQVYVSTSGSCSGVDNGVWALNLETKKVQHWKAPAAHVSPVAVSPGGTMFVTSGAELVALDSKTLSATGGHTAPVPFNSTPIVFEWMGRNAVAATTADGRLHVIDGGNPGAALASSRPFSKVGSPVSLATWVDPAGQRWILATATGAVNPAGYRSTNGTVTEGAIVAWKVVDKGGGVVLEPGWVSRNMITPKTPIIVNGVIFALAAGENKAGAHAVLYALDSITGKDVWSSGDKIDSYVTTGGLSAGGSRVYLSTHNGTQYAFGFPIETLD